MKPRATKQYWEGYHQALLDVAAATRAQGDTLMADTLDQQASLTAAEKLNETKDV